MNSNASFKRFLLIGACSLALLFLFFIALYFYDQDQEFESDLQNGYGVIVIGTINAVGGKPTSPMVTASYQYHGYLFNRELTNFHLDSVTVGTKVRLLISSIHPSNGMQYIGVDTTATKELGIPLSRHQSNY